MTGESRGGGAAPVAVADLWREYAGLAGSFSGLADFLGRIAALALQVLPSARAARISVRVPEPVTAVAGPPGPAAGGLAIPLVGGGDLAGMLELAPVGRDGFPAQERELAEVLAVLITLSLRPA